MNKDELRFIDRLYRDLYKSNEVLHHSDGAPTDKFNNIQKYMDKLDRIHERASKRDSDINSLKNMYYNRYVIKREDIPNSYYEMQERIALERGYGHIKSSEKQKKQMQDEIIENQKKSLDIWLDYFLSEDSKFYPFWAKYWAFQGMLKLGTFDKEKGKFNKRTNDTVSPFADLNREALGKSIDLIIKYIGKDNIEDKELNAIVKSGSFQAIYPYILNNILSNNENIIKRNEGRWIKYNQGSDHMPLVKSLQGYNTGWCTAGELIAKSQLSHGDFYVYYTKHENNEYKVPRVAIRMEYGKIGEIRGVAPGQNIEPDMEKVVSEKIKDFPDKDKYYKKVNDMKFLTEIYSKCEKNEELTTEELRFLYEIDNEIEGFGYQKDPRIEEIINKRPNKKEDLSRIYNCDKSQIALKKEEINKDTIYYYGDLDLSSLTTTEDLSLPKIVRGDLNLKYLTSAEGLELPRSVGGNLDLSRLTTTKGLELPQSVGGNLYLTRLTSAEGLELPRNVGGKLDLFGLTSVEELELPQNVGGDLILSGLIIAKSLKLPQSVGGGLYLSSLKSVEDLELPQNVRKSLYLTRLTSYEGLVLPQNVGGDLNLTYLTSAEGLKLPRNVGGNLDLSSLISAEGLKLPRNVGGNLDLFDLTSVEGLELPQNVGGDVILYSITSVEGLVFPDKLTYKIKCDEFTITPKNINEYRNNNKTR